MGDNIPKCWDYSLKTKGNSPPLPHQKKKKKKKSPTGM
jgi:hypothetical protein